jgi:hypothetical protein
VAEAFKHAISEYVEKLKLNPRFYHTFCDDDFMSVLKSWAKRATTKKRMGRASGIMRFSRIRMKTLKWRVRDIKNRRQ